MGQELLGHIKKEWEMKMLAEFLFLPKQSLCSQLLYKSRHPNISAHEKGLKFHAQPQTGPYSCFLNSM